MIGGIGSKAGRLQLCLPGSAERTMPAALGKMIIRAGSLGH